MMGPNFISEPFELDKVAAVELVAVPEFALRAAKSLRAQPTIPH